jgi:hypothetical protein
VWASVKVTAFPGGPYYLNKQSCLNRSLWGRLRIARNSVSAIRALT